MTKLHDNIFLRTYPITKWAAHGCISMYKKSNLQKFCFGSWLFGQLLSHRSWETSTLSDPGPFLWISVIQVQRYNWSLLGTLLMASTLHSPACFLSETFTHFLKFQQTFPFPKLTPGLFSKVQCIFLFSAYISYFLA